MVGSGSGGIAVMNVPGRSVGAVSSNGRIGAVGLGSAPGAGVRGIFTRNVLDMPRHVPPSPRVSWTPA